MFAEMHDWEDLGLEVRFLGWNGRWKAGCPLSTGCWEEIANKPNNERSLKSMGSLADSGKPKLCIVDSSHMSTDEIPEKKMFFILLQRMKLI